MQKIPNLEPYKLYSLIVEKISHSLRTPLGVSKAIVKDASQGEVLDLVDFEDAFAANQKMLSYLDLINKISVNLDSQLPENCSLKEIIPIEFVEHIHIAEDTRIKVVKLKINQLLYCLLSYFTELKHDLDEIRVYVENQKIILEISSQNQLQERFSEGFFRQTVEDGRLVSISFLVAMLIQPRMQYELIDQNKFHFSFTFSEHL